MGGKIVGDVEKGSSPMPRTVTLSKYCNKEIRCRSLLTPVIPRKQQGDGDAARAAEVYANQIETLLSQTQRLPTLSTSYLLQRGGEYSILSEQENEALQQRKRYIKDVLDIKSKFQERKRHQGFSHSRRASESTGNEDKTRQRTPKFGAAQRHAVLQSGSAIQNRAPSADCIKFVTLTFPGNRRGGFRELSRHSGYITNRLLQSTRDLDWQVDALYVIELQKRHCLHWHFVVAAGTPSCAESTADALQRSWRTILQDLGARGKLDLRQRDKEACWVADLWQCDSQTPRKDCSAYLSKYLSKGSQSSPPEYCPKRWWGRSRSIKLYCDATHSEIVLVGISEEDAKLIESIVAEWSQVKGAVLSVAKQGEKDICNRYHVEWSTGRYFFGENYANADMSFEQLCVCIANRFCHGHVQWRRMPKVLQRRYTAKLEADVCNEI